MSPERDTHDTTVDTKQTGVVGGVRATDHDEDTVVRKHGNFFTIDSRVWPLVCSLGLNPTVAYLVLATGTSKDMIHSTWSVHAVEKYTGISRLRAAEAIGLLQKQGLVSIIGRKSPRPVYRLASAEECLPRLGALFRDKGERPPSRNDLSSPAWIWLPKTLVTGAVGETPPVELVRQMRDVMTLRLLIELYGDQHLRVEGGVRRDVVWEAYKRHDLGARGEYRVWGFSGPVQYVRWHRSAAPHRRTGEDPTPGADFFTRIQRLVRTGLLEFVPHLVEGEDQDAEILHVYGMGNSDSVEDTLGSTASEAAYHLLTDQGQEWATKYHVAPVLQHIENVQMIGIGRLRYRAQTRATAAWQADLHSKAERYLTMYGGILAKPRS